jgi:putative transposase
MMYPLVRELAADGIPVTVTCRVLGFTPQRSQTFNPRESTEVGAVSADA